MLSNELPQILPGDILELKIMSAVFYEVIVDTCDLPMIERHQQSSFLIEKLRRELCGLLIGISRHHGFFENDYVGIVFLGKINCRQSTESELFHDFEPAIAQLMIWLQRHERCRCKPACKLFFPH